jgi:HlyD family secretion protein
MRIFKILIAIPIICLLVVGAAGCTRNTTSTTVATSKSQVAIGTISNAVTGSATLGLAKTQDLTFEMAGYVESISVEVSQTVTKGQVLAALDPSDWEDKIKTLENNLSSAQRALDTRQFALVKTKRVIDTKNLAKKQADINLLSAQDTLDSIDEVKNAQDAVDTIKFDIQYAETSRKAAIAMEDSTGQQKWENQIKYLNATLETANARLTAVLRAQGVSSTDVSLQITKAVFAVEQAQKAVKDAQIAIEDAQVDVDNAQLDVNDAQDNVDLAQSKLDDEKALNPQVIAPFDGFITSIKAAGGDEVFKGSVAMQIADPNKFEASFMVSESDIFSVKVGQPATVSVDALSNQVFEAKVTAIAPLATVSSGVVNYKVTAEITSLVPVVSALSITGGSFGGFPSGSLPSGIPTGARPSGFPSGGMPTGVRPTGTSGTIPSAGGAGSDNNTRRGPTASTVAKAASLKQGLSATVTITIQEKKNVLVVPLRAITTKGGKSTVQVVDGATTSSVDVTTGLSDASNIEIVSGLTEGQTVIVKASGTANTGNRFGGPGGFMP